MKQIFALAMVLMLASVAANAQTKYQYAEIIGTIRGMKNNSVSNNIIIDFGEFQKSASYDSIKTKIGTFERMADAINYLAGKGWELCSTYVVSDAVGRGTLNRQHWIIRKPK